MDRSPPTGSYKMRDRFTTRANSRVVFAADASRIAADASRIAADASRIAADASRSPSSHCITSPGAGVAPVIHPAGPREV